MASKTKFICSSCGYETQKYVQLLLVPHEIRNNAEPQHISPFLFIIPINEKN